MDGNGRWARAARPAALGRTPHGRGGRAPHGAGGHRARAYSISRIFSFSSENWARPASEIDDLMGLMKRFIRRDLAELHQNSVRIRVIGERDRRGRRAAAA